MIVLGVHDGTHDAGAALVVDGEVRHAVNEERFTRRKGQGGWPAAEIAECLQDTDDIREFFSSIGVSRLRGRLALCEKSGAFRVRLGTQTCATDPAVADAPVPPTGTGTSTSSISLVRKVFVDVDPTLANDGVIDTKAGFRLGQCYSSTDSSVNRGGDVVDNRAPASPVSHDLTSAVEHHQGLTVGTLHGIFATCGTPGCLYSS